MIDLFIICVHGSIVTIPLREWYYRQGSIGTLDRMISCTSDILTILSEWYLSRWILSNLFWDDINRGYIFLILSTMVSHMHDIRPKADWYRVCNITIVTAIVTLRWSWQNTNLEQNYCGREQCLLDDALADQLSIMKKQCFHFQGIHRDLCLTNSHHMLGGRKSSFLKPIIEHCRKMCHRQ